MLVAKIFFCTFAVLGAIYSAIMFKKGQIKLTRFIAWFCGSLALFFLILFIETTTKIANLIGIIRGVDFVIYLSFIFVFYLIMKLFLKIDALSSDISKIVRHIALDEEENESKEKKQKELL